MSERTIPAGWDETDFLVSINRQIGPTGKVILRSKTPEERRTYGQYWCYDYRNDADWDDHPSDLKEYWSKLPGRPPGGWAS